MQTNWDQSPKNEKNRIDDDGQSSDNQDTSPDSGLSRRTFQIPGKKASGKPKLWGRVREGFGVDAEDEKETSSAREHKQAQPTSRFEQVLTGYTGAKVGFGASVSQTAGQMAFGGGSGQQVGNQVGWQGASQQTSAPQGFGAGVGQSVGQVGFGGGSGQRVGNQVAWQGASQQTSAPQGFGAGVGQSVGQVGFGGGSEQRVGNQIGWSAATGAKDTQGNQTTSQTQTQTQKWGLASQNQNQNNYSSKQLNDIGSKEIINVWGVRAAIFSARIMGVDANVVADMDATHVTGAPQYPYTTTERRPQMSESHVNAVKGDTTPTKNNAGTETGGRHPGARLQSQGSERPLRVQPQGSERSLRVQPQGSERSLCMQSQQQQGGQKEKPELLKGKRFCACVVCMSIVPQCVCVLVC